MNSAGLGRFLWFYFPTFVAGLLMSRLGDMPHPCDVSLRLEQGGQELGTTFIISYLTNLAFSSDARLSFPAVCRRVTQQLDSREQAAGRARNVGEGSSPAWYRLRKWFWVWVRVPWLLLSAAGNFAFPPFPLPSSVTPRPSPQIPQWLINNECLIHVYWCGMD